MIFITTLQQRHPCSQKYWGVWYHRKFFECSKVPRDNMEMRGRYALSLMPFSCWFSLYGIRSPSCPEANGIQKCLQGHTTAAHVCLVLGCGVLRMEWFKVESFRGGGEVNTYSGYCACNICRKVVFTIPPAGLLLVFRHARIYVYPGEATCNTFTDQFTVKWFGVVLCSVRNVAAISSWISMSVS